MTNPLQGYHIHFDELVAENTVVLRRATYDFIVARYDAICASEPTASPEPAEDDYISATREHAEQPFRFGEPNEVIQAMDAADNPATEIHEDDELPA